MSKRPYDFLTTEKEPFLYIEKSKLVVKDGFLSALNGENGVKVIAPNGLLILMLGAGTSITQEAAIFCAQNDLQLCFARGGSNIHSIWMAGRYENPESLRNQIYKTDEYRLKYGKLLLKYRFKLLNRLTSKNIEEIDSLESINEILLYEARWAKSIYKEYSLKYNLVFKRNYDTIENDIVNERLNILNNALYSLITAICYSTNLSPSIAILHGESRRGGLTFDLADLIKTQVVFDLSFDNNEVSTGKLMHNFANKIKKNNQDYFKLIIKICLSLSEKEDTLEEVLKI